MYNLIASLTMKIIYLNLPDQRISPYTGFIPTCLAFSQVCRTPSRLRRIVFSGVLICVMRTTPQGLSGPFVYSKNNCVRRSEHRQHVTSPRGTYFVRGFSVFNLREELDVVVELSLLLAVGDSDLVQFDNEVARLARVLNKDSL